MRYKLGFFFTSNNKFVVSAKSFEDNELPKVGYYGDGVQFFAALRKAGLQPEQRTLLTRAANKAIAKPDLGMCSEEVELDEGQFKRLILDHTQRLVA